ncbi:MAG: HAD family hydrolase [Candidatus Bipolaricaulota bacterium]
MNEIDLSTVIFDLDDTLASYEESVEGALEKAFEESGVGNPPFSADQYREEYARIFDSEIQSRSPSLPFRAKIFLNLAGDQGNLSEEKILDAAQIFTQIREDQIKLFPDAQEVLGTLGERYKLGLLTNGPSDVQWGKIHALNIKSYFEEIVVSGDYGVSKPHSQIFHHALEKLKTSTRESIYIGNSLKYDIEGAQQVGIYAVWKDNDHEEEDLPEVKPDAVIRDLSELLSLITSSSKQGATGRQQT